MRVLIIEDDQRLANLIARVLTDEHYTVDQAHNGAMGLEYALRGSYDVAIVDWMLPERDGPSLCQAIRAAKLPTTLLLLTARGQLEDRVRGLDSGADDYLVKPFAFEELLARVRALARRTTITIGDLTELRGHGLVLDLRAHIARRGNRELDLTATEWNLVEYLMRHSGQTLTRQQILDYVWSYEREVQAAMVDVYISYVRRKINAADEADPIHTVRGIGYRWEPDDA